MEDAFNTQDKLVDYVNYDLDSVPTGYNCLPLTGTGTSTSSGYITIGNNTINSAGILSNINSINATGGYYYTSGGGLFTPTESEETKYTDFMFKLLGIDMDYIKFINMTESERTAFIRTYVIANIVK